MRIVDYNPLLELPLRAIERSFEVIHFPGHARKHLFP
jgi:hypothetical protein